MVSKINNTTAALTYSHTVGLVTMTGRGFYYPVDLAITSDEKMLILNRSMEIVDYGTRVTVCNSDSEYFGTFGDSATGNGQFMWPSGIAVDSEDNAYVTDDHLHKVIVFDRDGEPLKTWGIKGSGQGELHGPCSIAFDSNDNAYVSDHLNHRIQKFTRDGEFILEFGHKGNLPGELDLPWGLSAQQGSIWVADWGNHRVQEFSETGEFIKTVGTSGRGDGEMIQPSSVAVDPDGNIYVCDWGNERLQIFDAHGNFITKERGRATDSKWAIAYYESNAEEAATRERSNLEPDISWLVDDPHKESSHMEKYFWGPASVQIDDSGYIYVTETNRHRIQIFSRNF